MALALLAHLGKHGLKGREKKGCPRALPEPEPPSQIPPPPGRHWDVSKDSGLAEPRGKGGRKHPTEI